VNRRGGATRRSQRHLVGDLVHSRLRRRLSRRAYLRFGAQEAFDYFGGEQYTFLIFNGVLTIFSAFFFVWFLGMLHSVLRHAEGEGVDFSSIALAGGVMFVELPRGGGQGQLPSSLDSFCQLSTGCSTRVFDAGSLLEAVPFLPDRHISVGKRDLSGCAQDRHYARLAGLGGSRGRAPRTSNTSSHPC
jgi:hypothetical protein